MKKFTTLLLTAMLLGCDGVTPMTNDEIITAYTKCKEAGLGVKEYVYGFLPEIVNIQCTTNSKGDTK